MKIVDIRKPTIQGNSMYMLMSGLLNKDKFYKIIVDEENKKVIIREAEIGQEERC